MIAIMVSFIVLSKKTSFAVQKRQIPQILILGIVGQTLTTILINQAYFYIPAGSALTLHFLYPAIVTAICILFFKEKVKYSKLCVIAVAFLGTTFFFEGLTEGSTRGVVLAITSSITWAFYITYMERTSLTRMDASVLVFYQCIIMAICCMSWGTLTGEMRYQISMKGWIYILLSAILFCLAMVYLQKGVEILGAGTASVLGVFEPVSSLFFGALILGEAISKKQIAGTIIILISILILLMSNRKEEKEESL